jgi:hypothetical protein
MADPYDDYEDLDEVRRAVEVLVDQYLGLVRRGRPLPPAVVHQDRGGSLVPLTEYDCAKVEAAKRLGLDSSAYLVEVADDGSEAATAELRRLRKRMRRIEAEQVEAEKEAGRKSEGN